MKVYRSLVKFGSLIVPASSVSLTSSRAIVLESTHFPGFTQFNCALSDEDQIYTSLNHHAENRYHPNICSVEREKTARQTDCNGVLVVRSPTCISPTRSTNITRLQMLRSNARIPQMPNGNHDQKTARNRARSVTFLYSRTV